MYRSILSYWRVFYDKVVGAWYYGGTKPTRVYGDNSTMMHVSTIFRGADKIDDHLYLGNAFDAADPITLRDLGITRIVNATKEIRNYFGEGAEYDYLNIDVMDTGDSSLTPYFPTFLQFMNEKPDATVLIHCYMGSSRSAALALLYLVIKYQMTVEEGLEHLTKLRSVVNINTRFLQEVRDYVREHALLPLPM